MCRNLLVTSCYPNIRGTYIENGVNEGRPTFLRDASPCTCIFFSAKFGNGPKWYFAHSLPAETSMSSFCCSQSDATTPDKAQWPPSDIIEIKAQVLAEPALERCLSCQKCNELVQGLLCSICTPSADAHALRGLIVLHEYCDKPKLQTLAEALVKGDDEVKHVLQGLHILQEYGDKSMVQRLAEALVQGDSGVKRKLEQIVVAQDSQDTQPLILVEPPSCLEICSGVTNLVCHAFCVNGVTVSYQWCKNGLPLKRAERPRFVLHGQSSQDEGVYVCQVSAGHTLVSTQACQVKFREDSSKKNRFESPLRRASEAQQNDQLEKALEFLAEAIKLASHDEYAHTAALCQRSELLLQMGRLQEAFRDSTDAVRISPEFAHAHAIRGSVASKLGLLAEAVISWETAELLGGVSEAAHEVRLCRERLETFFAERRKTGGYKKGSEHNGWRRQYGSFSGKGSSTYSENGWITHSDTNLLQPLSVLGLACDAQGAPPSREAICTAYRRLALQVHPDKPGGSKAAFQKLQAAYEAVLKVISC